MAGEKNELLAREKEGKRNRKQKEETQMTSKGIKGQD